MYTVSMHTKRDLEFDITAPWWEILYGFWWKFTSISSSEI